jgi:sugar phosphate isomerase/epimerase
MIKSAVTIALVPQIKTGPWIFWKNLEESMRKAADLGFDAIELFTGSGDAISTEILKKLMDQYKLQLAAVGTGAGKVVHGLTLTDTNSAIRENAIAFIKEMMEFGAAFSAPAIIGSMQGNAVQGDSHGNSIALLAEALHVLDQHAASLGVKLIYEPLNRYETNLMNNLDDAAAFIESNKFKNITLLADLFHMNIEEADPAASIQKNRQHIGHVHFADSNRKPIGFGHTQMQHIADELKASGYDGYVSAEAFPWPDSDLAAEQTIRSFKQFFK